MAAPPVRRRWFNPWRADFVTVIYRYFHVFVWCGSYYRWHKDIFPFYYVGWKLFKVIGKYVSIQLVLHIVMVEQVQIFLHIRQWRTCSLRIVNSMGADVLATKGARASAVLEITLLSRIFHSTRRGNGLIVWRYHKVSGVIWSDVN